MNNLFIGNRPGRLMLAAGLCAVVALLAGCATGLDRLETGTPMLTRGQRDELMRTAKSPAELGLPARFNPSVSVGGVASVSNVTVTLCQVPTQQPRETGGQFGVPVILATVNGKAGVRVLLDSGSNRNLFGYALAHDLGVTAVAGLDPVTSSGIGGSVDNFIGVARSVKVDTFELRRVIALIGPDTQVLNVTHGFWNNPQAMILGLNTLRTLSYLSIDAPNGTVTFAPREPYQPQPGSVFVTAIPLQWVNGLPMVEVVIDGRPMQCYVDTGGDYGLLLPRQLAGELGYWKPGHEKVGISKGVGGASLSATYEVREARLGQAKFVKFPARTQVTGPDAAGGQVLLGNVCLRKLRVTFDFQHGQLWLER
ncbi:MAG: retropepsin-like aspartic protease [Verrucomicrobiota bacterium]